MKEIKIKYGYSDGINTFEKVFTLDEIEQGCHIDEICDSPNLKNYKIVYKRQYANRRDKNDIEIYEGDILKGGMYLEYEVAWDNKTNGWNIVNEDSIRINYEIIGNKYKNDN